jgi:hypothetical protein
MLTISRGGCDVRPPGLGLRAGDGECLWVVCEPPVRGLRAVCDEGPGGVQERVGREDAARSIVHVVRHNLAARSGGKGSSGCLARMNALPVVWRLAWLFCCMD